MITGETSVTITLVIAAVTVLCTLYNTFHGRSKDTQETIEQRIQQATDRVKELTTISVKLDNIGTDVRQTMKDSADIKNELRDLRIEVDTLKASVHAAHRRMDNAGIEKVE